jgi:hypothetical protein
LAWCKCVQQLLVIAVALRGIVRGGNNFLEREMKIRTLIVGHAVAIWAQVWKLLATRVLYHLLKDLKKLTPEMKIMMM